MQYIQWWGDFKLLEGQAISWAIGERSIVIERKVSEWNTWNNESAHELWEPLTFSVPDAQQHQDVLTEASEAVGLNKAKTLTRHLQQYTCDTLHIAPALADRSMVVRLSSPVRVLAGEKIRIYVSTPLWFQASVMPGKLMMLDIPFWRPSDSWFGANTRDGEFCYAKYTDARLQLNLLAPRVHRAITPIEINNKRDAALDIERLNIPVPLLSLYSDKQYQLWTQMLTVTRDEGNDLAEIQLSKQAPEEAEKASIVAEPRIKIEKHAFTKALSSLFA